LHDDFPPVTSALSAERGVSVADRRPEINRREQKNDPQKRASSKAFGDPIDAKNCISG
jgi:hypothetical protein